MPLEAGMRELKVLQAAWDCRWLLDKMASSLPAPGTAAFTQLVRHLHVFGVTPQDVTLDAPGNRLADTVLRFSLLQGQVTFRITYSGFDVLVSNPRQEHIQEVAHLVFIGVEVLEALQATPQQARVRVGLTCHAGIQGERASGLIEAHLPTPGMGALRPDALAYQICLDHRPDVIEMRIVIAKSLFYPDALFLDFSSIYVGSSYTGKQGPFEMAAKVQADYEVVLGHLNLALPRGGG